MADESVGLVAELYLGNLLYALERCALSLDAEGKPLDVNWPTHVAATASATSTARPPVRRRPPTPIRNPRDDRSPPFARGIARAG